MLIRELQLVVNRDVFWVDDTKGCSEAEQALQRRSFMVRRGGPGIMLAVKRGVEAGAAPEN